MLILIMLSIKSNGNRLPVKSGQIENLLYMNVIYRQRTGLA